MHYHKDTIAALEHELEARGYEFILISSLDESGMTGRVAFDGKVSKEHKHFRLFEKKIGSFTVRYQRGLLSLIKSIRPDIVVSLCHSGTLSEWQLSVLKKRLGFKFVAWQCGYEFNPSRLKNWILGKFIPRFDHHLAYHTNAKHYAIAHGARPDQVTVIHNTINVAAITYIPKDIALKIVTERWPAVIGKKIVLYVGAILEEKRLEVIFEALDILHREDVVFLMVGDGPHLEAIKNRYGHRRDFISTGQLVEGVGPYFDAADVFVLPGTGGLAINEAMAHGLVVISGYADGSADDLVIDGKNGFRLREGSAVELATRLQGVLSDSAVARDMGEVGRQMIQGKFSFERFIDRVVGVLVGPNN
jgi:glycosyltransferase involved in cell wall biosynthesis